jgi:hypothetical protein
MQLRKAGQVRGRAFGLVGDDNRKKQIVIVLGLPVARLVILDLLPVAELIRDQDDESRRFGDRIEQRRLPQVAISKAGLIDKDLRARLRLLDGCFERQRALPIRRVKAQKNTHRVH